MPHEQMKSSVVLIKNLFFFILICILSVAIIRTLLVKKSLAPRECSSKDVAYVSESRGLSKRLSQACRFQTITTSPGSYNSHELLRFQKFLQKRFPLVYSSSYIDIEIVNNYSILYRVQGQNRRLKPYLLLGHTDVVPATPSLWDVDPFAGVELDGFIYGRGTIDCKPVVMGILETLEYLLEKKYQPQRSLFIAFGHDEEGLGVDGAKYIADVLKKDNMTFEYILDEGLIVLEGCVPGVQVPTALIGVTEKGYLSLNLTVTSESGHSSLPPKDSAITILSKAVAKLEGNVHRNLFGYGPEVVLLQEAAPYASLPFKFLYANVWLFSSLIAWFFGLKPQTSATIRTTTAVTLISGGVKENIIPSTAWAVVNHRIHPAQTLSEVLSYDAQIISDERVKLNVLHYSPPHPVSPYSRKDFAYANLHQTIQEIFSTSIVLPALMVANTDTRWYLNFSTAIYRFSPVFMNVRDMVRIHGNNERISVSNYEQVVNFYHHLILNSDREELETDSSRDEL